MAGGVGHSQSYRIQIKTETSELDHLCIDGPLSFVLPLISYRQYVKRHALGRAMGSHGLGG